MDIIVELTQLCPNIPQHVHGYVHCKLQTLRYMWCHRLSSLHGVLVLSGLYVYQSDQDNAHPMYVC